MLITALELENELRNQLAHMDNDEVFANLEPITARLRAMGFYGLARDLSAAAMTKDAERRDEVLLRLYKTFGVELFGNIIVENISPCEIEFECAYGFANTEVVLTVNSGDGAYPLNLNKENIELSFSVDTGDNSLYASVISVLPSSGGSFRILLVLGCKAGAFDRAGVFLLRANLVIGKAIIAGGVVRLKAHNTIPARISDDEMEKRLDLNSPRGAQALPPRFVIQTEPKPVHIIPGLIQFKQKSTRIIFDKQGNGTPKVLCGNGAFRAGLPSIASVNISFNPINYKNMEQKLAQIGNFNIMPETAVWVEWEDFIAVYSIQYKGFIEKSQR
ncbi:MAG: hypothetical protein FWC95_02025 [Defluviitaleaceae bacterium]|nr:hypothetical protein [Defluviitaleaceae bacterium]